MPKLEPGDTYLSIQLFGKNGINVAAFKNPRKAENPRAPDYTGPGIAIWKVQKKGEQTTDI